MIKKKFYVDISELYHNDAGTGIQRVVRAIFNELKLKKFVNFDVVPVCWSDKNKLSFREYLKISINNELEEKIEPEKGDIFFGLDLAGGVVAAYMSGLYTLWRDRGVDFYFVIYDLLPLKHKEWWPYEVYNHHLVWNKIISTISTKLICISSAVKDDVEEWIFLNKPHYFGDVEVTYFHLGADINNSIPSKGIPIDSKILIDIIKEKPSFLMVGTIEPRKGHKYTLSVFEELWNENNDIVLIIVGKSGWMMDDFIEKIQNHTEFNKRLFWLNGISDEYLSKVYSLSTCLIAASEGEGFGLPLIEAAQYKIPIIARDIKVFREVAKEYAIYFPNNQELNSLKNIIIEWLIMYKKNEHSDSSNMPWLTWRESTEELIKCIKLL